MPRLKKTAKFVAVTNLLNLNVQDVVNYVHNLHQHIKKQNKRISKLKLKIQKMKFLTKLDAQIAKTSTKNVDKPDEKSETKHDGHQETPTTKPEQENVLDFVNEIKAQAMVNSFQQAGFIYEPTSGLYYDTKSTYYYSPQHDLYYDGNGGNWFRLNPRTHEFIFHSGTEGSQAVKKVQWENSLDSLLDDFKSLRIHKLRAHAIEIDEDEAIQRILDDGRKPTKTQEASKSSAKVERSRRNSTSSSHSSDDNHSRHRRVGSRSRSRSPSKRSRSRSRYRERNKNRRNRSHSSNREDGEIDSSDDSEDEYKRQEVVVQEKFKRKRKKKKGNDYEEIAKKYPPSLRIVTIESDKLDVGKLFVVTFKGGSLGREGNHDVLIPDLNVSKNHLKFSYNHKKSIYQFVDCSRNGTLLDGVQTSLMNQKDSHPKNIEHGSVLQLAKTKLLCHIHEGLTTCSECEPYNYVKKTTEELKATDEPQPSNLTHKEQLKLLQKRYGLATEKYQENPSGASNKNYEDRAEKRRVKVGSSHESVKTQQASVNTSISSENKGFKLLSKMGWSEGKSIGKSQEGIKEPVQVKTQQGTSGLGSDTYQPSALTFKGIKKKDIWNKTQERYKSIKKQEENIFGDDDGNER